MTSMTPFDILMVLALGSLAGTGIGLAIGYLARRQGPDWGSMPRRDRIVNAALVLIFSGACIACLAAYELFF